MKNIFVLLIIPMFLSACGGEATPAQSDMDQLMTASIGTMVQSFFETQTAMYTPETSTPASTPTLYLTSTPYPTVTFSPLPSPTIIYFVPTLGVLITSTPVVTGTPPTATVNPGALGYGCNNLAFIRDVTIPAGTVVQKGEELTKTWKVQNTGTCNWMYRYRLVFLYGDDLKADGDFIHKQVTVWDWSEVSLNVTAPNKPGTYTSYWRMADIDGNMFGATLILSFVVTE